MSNKKSDCCGAKIITGARTFDNFNGTICSSCGGACLDKIPEINPSPTPQAPKMKQEDKEKLNICCERCSGRVEDENSFAHHYGCQNTDCECHKQTAQYQDGRISPEEVNLLNQKHSLSPTPQEGWEIGIMSLKPLHDLERIGAVKEIEQIKDFVRTELSKEQERTKRYQKLAKEMTDNVFEARKDTLDEVIKIVEDADIPDYKIWVTARRIILNKIEALNSLRDE